MRFQNLLKPALFVAATSVLMFGCEPNKNSTRSSTNKTNVGVSNVSIVTNSMCTNNTANSRIGVVFDPSGGYTNDFEYAVKEFASSNIMPNELGTISGNRNDTMTGVRFEATLKASATGEVDLAQAKLKITIYDSFVGQIDSSGRKIQAYFVSFDRAASGKIDMNGGLSTIVFKDNYGEVTLEGRLNQSIFNGIMRFKNYTAVDGGAPGVGDLGAFEISRCGIGL